MQVELLSSESLNSLPSPDRYRIFPSSKVALVIFTLFPSSLSTSPGHWPPAPVRLL